MSGTATKEKLTVRHLLVVLTGIMITFGCSALCFSTWGLFQPVVAEGLGVEVTAFAMYVTVMYLTMTFASPFAGKLLQTMDIRILLSASAALVGCAFLLMSFSNTIVLFYVAAVMLGLGEITILWLAIPTLINRWFVERAGFFIGLCMAFTGIGGAIWSAVFTALTASGVDFHTIYLIWGVIALVTSLPFTLFCVRNSPEDCGLAPYGEVFYEHVCLALRAIDDGVAAVSARSSASFGTVNLGTTFTTQDHYLPSLIRDFEEAFDKRVIVKVSQGFTNYLTEQLHRGTLDVAFCGKRDNEPDIAYFPVKHCELALYVRDDHPLASRETITFGELNDVDLHTYRRGTPIGERVAKMLEEADVRGASLGYDDDVSMGSFLSYNGGNAGALMLDSLGAQLFSNLHQVRVEGIPEHFYTVYMAYHKKHVHSRAVADFIDFVKAYPGNDLIGQVLPTAPAE